LFRSLANASPNNISIGRRSVAPSKSKNANRYTASPRPSEANITPIPINPSVKRSLGRSPTADCSLLEFCANAIVPPTRFVMVRSFYYVLTVVFCEQFLNGKISEDSPVPKNVVLANPLLHRTDYPEKIVIDSLPSYSFRSLQ